MAVNDLNSFTIQGVLGSFLLICLLSFAVLFMIANNEDGLSDTGTVLEYVYENSSSILLETEDNADVLLNITSNTDPEISNLGSRDSVSTSYNAYGTAKSGFESAKDLIWWAFTGDTGKMFLGVFGGIIGLLAYFFIYKHIRQGN
jgi:hypothetical protein